MDRSKIILVAGILELLTFYITVKGGDQAMVSLYNSGAVRSMKDVRAFINSMNGPEKAKASMLEHAERHRLHTIFDYAELNPVRSKKQCVS